jgi:hypothetical protein
MVLACSLVADSECIVAEDTFGPYKTEEACIDRARVMIEQMTYILPGPHQYKFKCVPKGQAT